MAEASQSSPPTAEEKLEHAKLYKQEGNERFKNKEYKSAIGKYHRALLYVKGIKDVEMPMLAAMQRKSDPVSDEVKAEAESLKMDCYNNLSACLLQSEPPAYEKVVKYCDEILSTNHVNVKALYRRGVALYHLRNFDGALEVLQKAQTQPQGSKDSNVKKYITLCERELTKQDEKMKKTYKNMFDKMAMGDDKEVENLQSSLQQNGNGLPS